MWGTDSSIRRQTHMEWCVLCWAFPNEGNCENIKAVALLVSDIAVFDAVKNRRGLGSLP